MLISQEVYTQRSAMFNQTIYPKTEAGHKKLVPIKIDKPVDLYGGYSGSTDAYMAIVRIHDKKGDKYKVVGVPMRALDRLNAAKDVSEDQYNKVLKDVLTPQFTKTKKSRKTGEITQTVQDFEVVLGRVMYRQLVIDGNKKFMLGSSTYQYNAKQLVLSDKAVRILARKGEIDTDKESADYDKVYDEILGRVDNDFPLYDINRFRKKLRLGRDKFAQLPNQNVFDGNKKVSSGKREILDEILNGLHANATLGALKDIGFSTPFGKMQYAHGMYLPENTVLVFKSPTGLFERRITLKDL